jgi:hypothetical protein
MSSRHSWDEEWVGTNGRDEFGFRRAIFLRISRGWVRAHLVLVPDVEEVDLVVSP